MRNATHIRRPFSRPLAVLCLAVLAMAVLLAVPAQAADPRVKLTTSKGVMVLELYPDKAPATVANFLKYVEDGFYDGLVFHRVINGFMIQGGGLDRSMKQKQGRAPIPNEADNGLKNEPYTVAMARTPDPHSATSQFFINVGVNKNLDHAAKTPAGFGYCVFGTVVQGREVVDAIKTVPTGSMAGHADVPREPVEILKAEVVK